MARAAAPAGAVALFYLVFLQAVPGVEIDDPVSLVLLDREGGLLGAGSSEDQQWRFPPIESVPPRLEVAILQFEDRRFRRHPGVDPLAILRAAWSNLRAGRVVSGASTISMQVARLARGNKPRTLTEKAIEAFLALRMETAMDKDRILAMYVSHAPYGGNVVGVEAAAWRYLARSPHDLSWAEAAMLAVLPNNPALIHPGRNRDALRERRDHLLARGLQLDPQGQLG
ncbi:MAG: transglycosylase domain-containing protein, partial [Myxococcota bacterium]